MKARQAKVFQDCIRGVGVQKKGSIDRQTTVKREGWNVIRLINNFVLRSWWCSKSVTEAEELIHDGVGKCRVN